MLLFDRAAIARVLKRILLIRPIKPETVRAHFYVIYFFRTFLRNQFQLTSGCLKQHQLFIGAIILGFFRMFPFSKYGKLSGKTTFW